MLSFFMACGIVIGIILLILLSFVFIIEFLEFVKNYYVFEIPLRIKVLKHVFIVRHSKKGYKHYVLFVRKRFRFGTTRLLVNLDNVTVENLQKHVFEAIDNYILWHLAQDEVKQKYGRFRKLGDKLYKAEKLAKPL